jgi:modified peptide precursor CbpA
MEATVKKTKACTPKKAVARGPETKGIVASRKSCKAKGTGLSHYILMDRKPR